MKTRCYTLFFTFLLAFSAVKGQVELVRHDKLDYKALRFWYADGSKPSHKFNRNISPKGDCIQVTNGFLFLTWYKGGMQERNLMISRLNLTTNKWVDIEFPDQNSLYRSGEYGGGGNSHRTTCIGVSPLDGTVHVAYDMHAGELKYRISDKNVAFGPDSEFTLDKFSPRRNYLKSGEPITSFTYPNIQVNNKGELMLEYRRGTTRQGDKYLIVYDGSWSKATLVMKGDNERPEFNQYGGFKYFFDKLYMGASVRIKGSDTEFNQGFYFADAGQNGTDQKWKSLNGYEQNIPIKGLNQMNKYKIASPLPNKHRGMTSSPEFVVSKNGAVHFTNQISGQGIVHYYSKPNSTQMIKASGSSPEVSFPGDDGRIYSVALKNDNLIVRSTKEGESNWRTDYEFNKNLDFDQMVHEYRNGKIYIIASEKLNSDKLPLHFIEIDVKGIGGNTNQKPVASFTKPATSNFVEGYNLLEISVNASDADGTVTSTELFIDDNAVRKENQAPYDWGKEGGNNQNETLNLSVGKHLLKVIVTDNEGATTTIQKEITVSEKRGPYYSTPMAIPGVIEAEDYDKGGQGIAYSDSESENKGADESNFRVNDGIDIGNGNDGKVVGWTADGEWLEYTIDIKQSGEYEVTAVTSSKRDGGTLLLYLNSEEKTEIDVPGTDSWDTYTSTSKSVELPQGVHTLRAHFKSAGFNLDKMQFERNVATSTNGKSESDIVKIFPNPSSSGIFNINTDTNYELFNMLGESIIKSSGKEINLSSYPDGVYLVKVNNRLIKIIK